jgi:hypothetical protein
MKINMRRLRIKFLNERPLYKEINNLLNKNKRRIVDFYFRQPVVEKIQNNNDIKLQYLCEVVEGIVHT